MDDPGSEPHGLQRTTALLGGSFDPPHVCHLLISMLVLQATEAEEVWWIPCSEHAFGKPLSPIEVRLELCELATRLVPAIQVSRAEVGLAGPSYTFDTLARLRREEPDRRFLWIAGSDLLPELPRWHRWAALAEQFMLDSFDEHTSGAWTESPSYGNYGVNEWLRLAELLRNVAGRDHLQHAFLKRYANYQLMICDWEGRNLGYNGGGAGQRWNHWVFFYIARELRSPQTQWLANFCIEKDTTSFMGYGDAFWWADPTFPPADTEGACRARRSGCAT